MKFGFSCICIYLCFPISLCLTVNNITFSSIARLTVNVLDVNDNAPRFRPFGVSNFTEKILEGAQPGTTLLSVSAVDPDKGPNGQVIYKLLHLPRGGYIRLEDPSTGMALQHSTSHCRLQVMRMCYIILRS